MQWFIGLISLWHLCGSRKGTGTLRKACWDPQALRAYDSSASKRIYALPALEYSPAPHWGDSHGRQRGYWSVMNGSLLCALWTSLHSSQACNCLGKLVRVLWMLPTGNWASWYSGLTATGWACPGSSCRIWNVVTFAAACQGAQHLHGEIWLSASTHCSGPPL